MEPILTMATHVLTQPPPGRVFTFGLELALDLHGCNREAVADPQVITTWAQRTVEALDMKAYGPLLLEHFGHDNPVTSGYTAVQNARPSSALQLIETSALRGRFTHGGADAAAHLGEEYCTAALNLFSCQFWQPVAGIAVAVELFRPTRVNGLWIVR